MKEYLEHLRKNKSLSEVPGSVKERSILVKNLLGNPVKKYLALYNLLKKVDKAEYYAIEEFRKNVTLRLKGSKSLDIKVDDLYNYLIVTRDFVVYMRQLMKESKH